MPRGDFSQSLKRRKTENILCPGLPSSPPCTRPAISLGYKGMKVKAGFQMESKERG